MKFWIVTHASGNVTINATGGGGPVEPSGVARGIVSRVPFDLKRKTLDTMNARFAEEGSSTKVTAAKADRALTPQHRAAIASSWTPAMRAAASRRMTDRIARHGGSLKG